MVNSQGTKRRRSHLGRRLLHPYETLSEREPAALLLFCFTSPLNLDVLKTRTDMYDILWKHWDVKKWWVNTHGWGAKWFVKMKMQVDGSWRRCRHVTTTLYSMYANCETSDWGDTQDLSPLNSTCCMIYYISELCEAYANYTSVPRVWFWLYGQREDTQSGEWM